MRHRRGIGKVAAEAIHLVGQARPRIGNLTFASTFFHVCLQRLRRHRLHGSRNAQILRNSGKFRRKPLINFGALGGVLFHNGTHAEHSVAFMFYLLVQIGFKRTRKCGKLIEAHERNKRRPRHFFVVGKRRREKRSSEIVAEPLGVDDRIEYYDKAGAMRDVVQNHLLQLLALVAMEPPVTFDANAVRDEKVKVLRAIRPIREEDLGERAVRGQYGPGFIEGDPVAGYHALPEVPPESMTETFVGLKLFVDNWRWEGTPFYLRHGKRLPKRATEIAIQFRSVPHHLFSEEAREGLEPNTLVVRIQPEEGISLKFGAKVPVQGIRIRSVAMDFVYGASFLVDAPDAYETLLLDALRGDATLFTRQDEVEEQWRLVDPIIASWREGPDPPPAYAAGTWGPAEADLFIARDGRRWRQP